MKQGHSSAELSQAGSAGEKLQKKLRQSDTGSQELHQRAIELAEAEAELPKNEERLRLACNAGELGTYEYDPISGSLFCDAQFRTLWGIGPDAGLSLQLLEAALRPDNVSVVREALRSAFDPAKEGHLQVEFRISSPEHGSERWIRAVGRCIFDQVNGERRAIRLIGTVQEISAEKKQQQLLQESEKHLQLLRETMLQGLIYHDREGKIISANPAATSILGRSAADLIGTSPDKLKESLIKEDGTPFSVEEFPVMQVLATGKEQRDIIMGVFDPESRHHTWISADIVPLFRADEDKPYQAFTLFDYDISPFKRSDEVLQDCSAFYRRIVETAQEAICTLDMEGKITYANQRLAEILGYTLAEILGHYSFDFMDKEQHGAAYQLLEQNRKGIRESFDLRLRHRSGREIWVRVSSAPAFDAAGNVTSLFAMISDITDLVQSEQALKRAYSEIKKLKDQLTAEADYLRLEIAETKRYGDLIGRSKPFLEVLKKVEQVAATDTSVVITGETGTGKELIARKIHGLSRRRSHTMICVNCASLPVYLVENELFGRERGAYTGALTAHAGRFEVANGSTLFLDEVGELPLDLQAKLLRVLQEGEFERLGSTKTVRVDVRVIVASNRDLAELVAEGKIRQDLFYRLNVYPIHLPPLRERTEDIPLFVKAFVAEFTRRTGKSIHRIPESTMEALISYYWPGNVRELRNVIEHAVIASERGVLLVDLGAVHTPGSHRDLTLQEVEAAHIQTILERSGWRIKGRAGAARTLGLEPSTLYSKMRKLGITNRTRRGEKQSHG